MLTDVRPMFTIHDQHDGPDSVTLLMTIDATESDIGQYDTIDEAVLALKAVKNALGAIERFNDAYVSAPSYQGVDHEATGAGWAMASFLDGADDGVFGRPFSERPVEPHPIADTHHLRHPANQGPCVPRDPAAFPHKQPPADGPLLSGEWGSTTQLGGARSGNDGQYTPGEQECLQRYLDAEDAFAPYLWLVQLRNADPYAQYMAGKLSLKALKERVGPLTAPSAPLAP